MNKTQLYGRLAYEPELRVAGTTTVTRFTIAVDKKLSKDKRQELESNNKPTADFIQVVAWGKLGELVKNYSGKGKRINVVGRIETGSYEKDGRRIYTTEVVAEEIDIIDWRDSNDNQEEPVEDYSNDFEPDYAQEGTKNRRVPF